MDDWGDRCHEGQLFECDERHPCDALHPGLSPLECVRGVCVRSRAATGTCYSHADCEV